MEGIESKHKEQHNGLMNSLKLKLLSSISLLLLVVVLEATIFALVLKALNKYNSMFLLIILCVISNIIITILLFAIFTINIKKSSLKIYDVIRLVSSGDLSVNLDIKNQKTLGKIANHVNSITSEMRKIIQNTYNLTKSIVASSLDMSVKVSQATSSVSDISKTVNEIADGASLQVSETQNSIELFEDLTNQINLVNNSYNFIVCETDNISELNKKGRDTVNDLKIKSEEINVSSIQIFSSVENLTRALEGIGLLVQTIQNIADKTNLLALNAAIEAARAGDSGNGFAVVAGEIRRLADESKRSTGEIRNMISGIQDDSQQVNVAMNSMQDVLMQQLDAVDQTGASFQEIAIAIDNIVQNIKDTSNAVSQMEKLKNSSIEAIQRTAAISEQAAAASEELAANIDLQMNVFDALSKSSEELNQMSNNMNKSLEKYKL